MWKWEYVVLDGLEGMEVFEIYRTFYCSCDITDRLWSLLGAEDLADLFYVMMKLTSAYGSVFL